MYVVHYLAPTISETNKHIRATVRKRSTNFMPRFCFTSLYVDRYGNWPRVELFVDVDERL